MISISNISRDCYLANQSDQFVVRFCLPGEVAYCTACFGMASVKGLRRVFVGMVVLDVFDGKK